jgi:hypothetical protein
VSALYTQQPELHHHHCYLFLDEVQNEERALKSAEKELGFKGRIIDWENYLTHFFKISRRRRSCPPCF